MKLMKNRTRKLVSLILTAALTSGSYQAFPVAAEKAKVAEDSSESRDITFSVEEGDLLIAVNPVAWEQKDDGWDKKENNIGYIDITTPSSSERETAKRIHFESVVKNADSPHCKSMELREEERAWYASHPEAVKGKPVRLSSEEATEYAVGDWIWHGYNSKKGNLTAEKDMEGAPFYSGDEVSDWRATTNTQVEGAEQVYRKYVCLAVGGEKGSGYTIWGYVAGSETNERPSGALRGKADKLPTYLSQNRAEKIVEDLEEMEFMKKLSDAAGDYTPTDRLGDNDGRIAFFFEPIETDTLGFSWFTDQREKTAYFDPAFSLDCLHIQLQITIGDEVEEEIIEDGKEDPTPEEGSKDPTPKYNYTDETGTPPFSTMAHELTHYIVNGYCFNEDVDYDTHINEWFAQSVMMQVNPWNAKPTDDKTIWNDVNGITNNIKKKGYLGMFAGDIDDDECITYPISTLAAGYYTGRMGDDIWKDAIKGAFVTEDRLSEFLKKRDGALGKGLDWWRAAFCISILGNAEGAATGSGDDIEFRLNPYDADNMATGTTGGTHKAVCDTVLTQLQDAVKEQEKGIPEGQSRIVEDLSLLSRVKDIAPVGGGCTRVFKVGSDIAPGDGPTDVTIKGVGPNIVWAHKTASGEIELDEVLPEEEENNEEKPSQKKAIRNEDGSWDYSDAQEEALALIQRPEIKISLDNTGALVSIRLYARSAVSFNKNKKRLTADIADLSKCSVSVDGTPVDIKKLVIKNPKKAYVSENSIFKETISENNLSAYGMFKDKKKPGIYLVLDKRGLSGDLKKAVTEANKELKKNPIPIEILPLNFIKNQVMVEYDENKDKVKKLVVFSGGSIMNLRCNQNGKKDFSFDSSDKGVKITGTNNYNGSFYYDPANHTQTF